MIVNRMKGNAMITVKCNKNDYAYDVHSLVKAFYPAEDVKVIEEGEKTLTSSEHLPEIFIFWYFRMFAK